MSTAYDLTGARWNGTQYNDGAGIVTWGFASHMGARINEKPYRDAVQAAFDEWESVADIDFVYRGNTSFANISIGWGDLDGNGAGGSIALASWRFFYTSGELDRLTSAQVEFDTADFSRSATASQVDAGLFYQTALHEIGHTIGLEHYDATGGEIMNSIVRRGKKELGEGDIAGIQKIYGPAPGYNAGPEPEEETGSSGSTGTTNYTKTVNGTNGADRFVGTSANEKFLLGGGADQVNAGGGDDYIHAGSGADWQIRGGAGSDVFAFKSGDYRAMVWDFEDGQDMIEVDVDSFDDVSVTGIASLNLVFIDIGGGDRMILQNTLASAISEDDFSFV